MENMIDSHQHFWQVGRFDYPWMTPEVEVLCQDYLPPALEPILKRCGVEKTVLVQASNSLEETRWLLSLADQYPFVAGVVGWVDLATTNIGQQLDEFVTEANWANWRVEDLKPFTDKALEYFGPQRMMFGSDWPVCLLAASYDRVLEAFQSLLSALSDDDQSRLFGGNANEFYRLQMQAELEESTRSTK